MDGLREPFDADTGARLLALMHACAAGCANGEAFRGLMRQHVHGLIPHQRAIALLANLSPGHLSIERMVSTDDPGTCQWVIPTDLSLRERPALSTWLCTREPVVVEHADTGEALWLPAASAHPSFGAGRLAMHGQIDISARMTTHFCLAGVSATLPAEAIRLRLRLITPHLHAAFMSIPAVRPVRPVGAALTPLQRDLLAWLTAGHSNAEIAALRGRSTATVRNQLHTLYARIGVASRAEAVAFAARQPVFSDDENLRER